MINRTKAEYLLRFDDICPTMNWQIWSKIESILIEKNIRPILAVVPDIRDPELMVSPPAADFWDRVRKWQSWGWTIGLHGYQHLYVNDDPGIMGITKHSEFTKVSREEQHDKLTSGLKIFECEGVKADCWIAPSHSFDRATLDLLNELGLRVVSDGLWPLPHTDKFGMTWVPLQLWDKPRPMPFGVWTVCYHHNDWDETRLADFRENIELFSSSIVDLPSVLKKWTGRRLSISDRMFVVFFQLYRNRLHHVVRWIWKR